MFSAACYDMKNVRHSYDPRRYFLVTFLSLLAISIWGQEMDSTAWRLAFEQGTIKKARKLNRASSRFYFDQGENESGLAILHRYWEAIGPIDSLRREYINLALDISRISGTRLDLMDSAQYYQAEAMSQLESFSDSILLGKAFTYQGWYYARRGYPKIAMEWYLRSLTVKEATGYHGGIGYSYFLIGKLYYQQGFLDKSLEYYQRAIEEARLGGVERQMTYLKALGELYAEMEEEELALKYLNQSLEAYVMGPERNYFLPLIHSALGKVYAKFGQVEKALSHQYEALRIVEQRRNLSYTISALVDLSQSHLTLGHFYQARQYLDRCAILHQQVDLPRLLVRYYATENNYYRAVGDYRKAWEVQEQYQLLQDSLASAETSARIVELEQLYKDQKDEKHIASLENQRLLDEEKLSRERWRRYSLVLFSTILLLLLGLISYLFYQNKSKNQSLQRALTERQLLIREIHHRVKNNLQLVSSLLFLQAKDLEKEGEATSAKMLKAMQRRVKSMALVHQKLYQEDTPGFVSAPEYIDDLLAHLLPALGLDPQRQQVQVDIEALRIDVDTMMSIGLLLNEWLTNAFKYASPQDTPLQFNILLCSEKDYLLLSVKDNGQNPHTDLESVQGTGFGRNLVQAIAEKLKAEILHDTPVGGEVKLLIYRFKLYQDAL